VTSSRAYRPSAQRTPGFPRVHIKAATIHRVADRVETYRKGMSSGSAATPDGDPGFVAAGLGAVIGRLPRIARGRPARAKSRATDSSSAPARRPLAGRNRPTLTPQVIETTSFPWARRLVKHDPCSGESVTSDTTARDVARCIAMWNEADPDRRRALVSQIDDR
jgi:hypothetical protein